MTRLLVCPPTYYGVEYVINPWMAGNVGEASQPNAMRQWDALVAILEDHAEVVRHRAASGPSGHVLRGQRRPGT